MWNQKKRKGRGWGSYGSQGQSISTYAQLDSIPLIMIPPGRLVEVVNINAGVGLWERLIGMGIRPGTKIQVLANDYRGVIVGINNTRYALGRGMAEKILVRLLSV